MPSAGVQLEFKHANGDSKSVWASPSLGEGLMPTDGDRPESLLAYLAVIRRWKWIVVSAALLVPIAALLVSLGQQKLYRSSAQVLLSQQDLGSALTGIPNATASQDPARYSQTQADLARVPEVARRTIDAVHGRMGVGEFLSNSSVSPKQNSNLLIFTV